ncbi:MAG: 4-alpha-glucanotransferase [Lachnospiraceae bacterium]|nr:4-alpha-glucanotransferase [Lachnospiraceae bacterium]
MRRSGILMPISSLPGPYGIGTFSKEAYRFVDFLAAAGQSVWQILPLGPTGYGDSPYQSFSTFAGNPYFIDLEALIREKALTRKECEALDWGGSVEYVDYEKMYISRFIALRKAFGRARKTLSQDEDFFEFIKKNYDWVADYALYMAIKDANGGKCWIEWEEDIRLRRPEALEKCREEYTEDILFYEYLQYQFDKQWTRLKAYANQKGIKIVGDVPIYVAFDSMDTWANPELFQLDEDRVPIAVAGCPPDAFSATGQLWGNPLYAWDYHKKTGYAWWISRMKHCFALYDIVRIDHFRGFDEYYSIPYGTETAVNGKWLPGPGIELFEQMEKALGRQEVVAEDLGVLTDSVLAMVKATGYPGMKPLQFAFGGDAANQYLPHNYDKNCVVYTGTHDNQTTRGWYHTLDKKTKKHLKEYAEVDSEDEVNSRLIRLAMMSVADTAVIPMQDYLDLGDEARINTPSTLGDNWKWRMKKDAATKELAKNILRLTKFYNRYNA